jgi:hypothetical protein
MNNPLKPPARLLLNFCKALAVLPGASFRKKFLVSRVRSEGLTYLPMQKISKIFSAIRSIEEHGIAGDFIEAGCALGGSSILIASFKNPARRFFVYDVFGMIPPPGAQDPEDVHRRYETIKSGQARGLAGQSYYGYRDGLRGEVERNLQRHGVDKDKNSVFLVEGLVQETLHIHNTVAFAHIDVDWHDPVKVCLERIHPQLAIGGCVILDDYSDWGGCRKAVDRFLEEFGREYSIENSHQSFVMRKNARQCLLA